MFAGKGGDWDEFVIKLKAQLAAANMFVANVVECTEAQLTDAELEADDYAEDWDPARNCTTSC